MKRSLFILAVLFFSASCFGLFHLKTCAIRAETQMLLGKYAVITNESRQAETQLADLDQKLSQRIPETKRQTPEPLMDPQLANWLLAGSFQNAPASVMPKLSAALGLPWRDSGDSIWVSKSTLRALDVPAVKAADKLSDTLCAILAITPQKREQIEEAMARARGQFCEWAKTNVQREGPSGDMLVRFTIPYSEEVSSAVTNQLYSALNEALGAERTGFFDAYADSWLQINLGYLGAVTNTLTVLQHADGFGKSNLEYLLTREGSGKYGQMGESGVIDLKHFPPLFRNIFPGGWKEVAAREGFPLPVNEVEP